MPVLELAVKGRWLWAVIGANLVVLVSLVFVYPHLMVAPGALVPGHAQLATDCFACHTPLRGATADRCLMCHQLPDIGLRTTQGLAVVSAKPAKVAFHQQLNDQNCMACHSDHAGPKLTQHSRKPFSHALLREGARDRCEACHQPPADTLHRQLVGNCGQCHQAQAWKPATFEHNRFFPLDRDHNASCITCHSSGTYKQFTCYGCHEHTPANIQAKHRKEGISENLDNCVRCHRNGKAEDEGKGGGEGRKGKREKD